MAKRRTHAGPVRGRQAAFVSAIQLGRRGAPNRESPWQRRPCRTGPGAAPRPAKGAAATLAFGVFNPQGGRAGGRRAPYIRSLVAPRARAAAKPLLPSDGDPVAFLSRDEVVGVLGVGAEIDLNPTDSAGECAVVGCVVVTDRGGGVAADVGGLVAGEDH